MQEFTIKESNQSLTPSSTGRATSFYTGRGDADVAATWRGIGETAYHLGDKWLDLQGEAELIEKVSEANEGFQKLQQELIKETDPAEYQRKYDDYWNGVKNTEFKSGRARRAWKSTLPTMNRSQQSQIFNAQTAKIRENHDYAIASLESNYVQTGEGYGAYKQALKNKQQSDGLPPAFLDLNLSATDKKREAKLHADNQQNMSSYAYNNPDDVLSWKNAEDMKKKFPDALPTDITWIQGVARGIMAQKNAERAAQSEKFNSDVRSMIRAGQLQNEQGTSLLVDIEKARESDLISGPEYSTLTSLYDARVKSLQESKKLEGLDFYKAVNEIRDAIEAEDKDKADQLLAKYSGGLSDGKIDELIKDIKALDDPSKTKTNPNLNDALGVADSILSSVSSLYTTNKKLKKEAQKDPRVITDKIRDAELKTMRIKEQLRQWDRDNPNATPEQRINGYEAILKPIKDDAAKDTIDSFWDRMSETQRSWMSAMSPTTLSPSFPPYPSSETNVPTGLEELWKTTGIDSEWRTKALKALQEGFTSEQIMKWYRENVTKGKSNGQ